MPKSWPWPDSPIKRRERVALSYRAALARADPVACKELDEQMVVFEQRWVVPQVVTHQDDDLLTAALAADYAAVSLRTVYVWRQRGLPSVDTPDGIRFRFATLRGWVGGQRDT